MVACSRAMRWLDGSRCEDGSTREDWVAAAGLDGEDEFAAALLSALMFLLLAAAVVAVALELFGLFLAWLSWSSSFFCLSSSARIFLC